MPLFATGSPKIFAVLVNRPIHSEATQMSAGSSEKGTTSSSQCRQLAPGEPAVKRRWWSTA